METQGFDEKKDAPTEIGLVIFDRDLNELATIECFIKSPITRHQPQEIIEITGITDEMIATGTDEALVVEKLEPLFKDAEAIFAYNAPFDMRFLTEMFKRQGKEIQNVTVVDVQRDIEYPKRFTCKKLSHLAYDHGIIEPKENLHRAVNDVRLMLKVVAKYNLHEIVAAAAEPKVKLRIMTEKPWEDAGKSNEFAKANGFNFDPPTKHWLKTERKSKVEDLIKSSKWEIKVLA